MADQSTCMSPSCGITIEGSFKRCPQCGGLMRTSRSIRAFGWVMLVCGVAVILIMGWLGLTFLGAGSFTGTTDEAALAIAGFSFVILFGLLASVNALYMVVTGRTNRALVKAMLLAVGILIVASVASRWLLRLLR